jgi:hypothetical protein
MARSEERLLINMLCIGIIPAFPAVFRTKQENDVRLHSRYTNLRSLPAFDFFRCPILAASRAAFSMVIYLEG